MEEEKKVTSCAEIYDAFLMRVTDYNLGEMNDEDIQRKLFSLLKSAIAVCKPLSSPYVLDPENQEQFDTELLPIDIEYIASYMVFEWIKPQLYNTLLVNQYFGTKDDRFFSQANHIEMLKQLQEETEIYTKKLRRDYTYNQML